MALIRALAVSYTHFALLKLVEDKDLRAIPCKRSPSPRRSREELPRPSRPLEQWTGKPSARPTSPSFGYRQGMRRHSHGYPWGRMLGNYKPLPHARGHFGRHQHLPSSKSEGEHDRALLELRGLPCPRCSRGPHGPFTSWPTSRLTRQCQRATRSPAARIEPILKRPNLPGSRGEILL